MPIRQAHDSRHHPQGPRQPAPSPRHNHLRMIWIGAAAAAVLGTLAGPGCQTLLSGAAGLNDVQVSVKASGNSAVTLRDGSTRESESEVTHGTVHGWPLSNHAKASFIVGNGLGPIAPPPLSVGDQASAEQAIRNGYVQKLAHCGATRSAVANVQSISWDPPGFSPTTGGSGMIHDADPRLGGPFIATPITTTGRWSIQYRFC